MKIVKCRAVPLTECSIPPEKWKLFTKWKQIDDWLADETFREQWKSFDCLVFNPTDRLVYAGLTALNGDFFYAFDPYSFSFESLHYPVGSDCYAHKIHAGLSLDEQGNLWGATATLSDVDAWAKAPGGELFRFNPHTHEYTSFGKPFPHDYIQGIRFDEKRRLIFGNTFPGRILFYFDLVSGKVESITNFGGTLSERILQDPEGCIWHNYHLTQWADRTPLLRYNPDTGKLDCLNIDLPNSLETGTSIMDSCMVTRAHEVFIGGNDGTLSQFDSENPTFTSIGKPTDSLRMKGLLEHPSGLILGAIGKNYATKIFSYDRTDGKMDIVGDIQDTDNGVRSWLAHDLCLVDRQTIVAAETDNPERSSCLFVISLEE